MVRAASAVIMLMTSAIHAAEPAERVSFLNEVVPLLTRLGCNQGACHGKGTGQNGFRLSLRGYAPEQDLASITREFAGRRINPAVPETSLLLQKPLGIARHEGGKILAPDSREFRTLLEWIRQGAVGPDPADPTLRRLTLSSLPTSLKVGDSQPLRVTAEFSDGTMQDATWLARFDTNDAAVATVSPEGIVTVRGYGETAVRATVQTEVAVTIVTSPWPRVGPAMRVAGSTQPLDQFVERKLAALNIDCSELCDDAAFIRRASLDTIGVLPTPDEVRAFLADSRPDKRAQLVDTLLTRPEWVDFWTLQLCDLLQNRKERDHDVRGAKGVRAFHEWVRRQVEVNQPWDRIVRNVLTGTGSESDHPEIGYYVVTVGEQREAHRSEVVASVAQAFLGTRIGCAQCHNHPLERYTQDDYYHFAAYFSRVRLDRRDPKDGRTALRVSPADAKQNGQPIGVFQPRTGRFLAPRALDRREAPLSALEDPRTKLADWIVNPGNAAFSGAMVNRLWKHFFAVGLVEPVDDLRATNPPSNPELWQFLNREFVAKKFDLKHIMRLILNSRTYQRDSATTPGNRHDSRYYSHYYARRLSAEVLADAISAATGVPEQYSGYPLGLRAVQLPDPSVKSSFLALFGRSDRITACACERTGDVAMVHTLHLLNGESIMQRIEAADGRLAQLKRQTRTGAEIIEELYLATFARRPTPDELANIAAATGKRFDDPATLADVFWALLNSKDFVFNR